MRDIPVLHIGFPVLMPWTRAETGLDSSEKPVVRLQRVIEVVVFVLVAILVARNPVGLQGFLPILLLAVIVYVIGFILSLSQRYLFQLVALFLGGGLWGLLWLLLGALFGT